MTIKRDERNHDGDLYFLYHFNKSTNSIQNAINISNGIISFILVDVYMKHVEMRESSNDKRKDLNIHLVILLVKKNNQHHKKSIFPYYCEGE